MHQLRIQPRASKVVHNVVYSSIFVCFSRIRLFYDFFCVTWINTIYAIHSFVYSIFFSSIHTLFSFTHTHHLSLSLSLSLSLTLFSLSSLSSLSLSLTHPPTHSLMHSLTRSLACSLSLSLCSGPSGASENGPRWFPIPKNLGFLKKSGL